MKELASRFFIITDDQVGYLYGDHLKEQLHPFESHIFSFPPGEKNKTRATKELIENQMLEKGFGRDICVIALGGGVVSDLAGYVAATYCRGVPWVVVPTSLLAMVDASIGGKTGVNTPYGKNMIGAIYPPIKVVIDLFYLKSLPQKEMANGFAEMIKHGLIADASLFEYLEAGRPLEDAIHQSRRIKKEIVEEDEKENGKRRLLNFGHTIGHALELITDYSLSHGEAVAIGLLIESDLSGLDKNSLARIKNLLLKEGLPLKLPFQVSADAILNAMAIDKKSINSRPRFVMIDKIGSARTFNGDYCTFVDQSKVKKALYDFGGY